MRLLESMQGSTHPISQREGCFKGYNLQIEEEENIVLLECQTKQNLPNFTALSALPEDAYRTGTRSVGGIDAAVKPGWLFQITVSGYHGKDTQSLVNMARQMGGFQGLKFVWAIHPIAFTPHFQRQTIWKVKGVSKEDRDVARAIPQHMLELRDLLPTDSNGAVEMKDNQLLAAEK